MEYTDESCSGDKHGHGALNEGGVRAIVSPKEERKEREGGSSMRDEA